ncbi:hypothetical protein [Sphingomonas sp.]|uniref:hypothetical protein n=1 Tax=Sphingomonas sp. TaxID=28214 RepID=UPI002E15547A|nr:hypothetical protein [Sphingomonas sp.]
MLGEEIYAATLDLAHRLPPDLARARMVCIPILISVTRDLIDREMRAIAVARGPSINAIASSLDVPFETARRNVQRMADLGWVEIGHGGGVSLPTPMPRALAEWCIDLGGRMRRAADRMEALGATDPGSLGEGTCDNSYILAALDLMLVMAGTSQHFGLRFTELLLIHFVCTASVVHLNAQSAGTAPFARADTAPDPTQRIFIPMSQLARVLGLSRSTVYRLVADAERADQFERRGNGVRASDRFLNSPAYVEALELVSGRSATLFSRVKRHRCGLGCTALDHVLRRPRPWRQSPGVAQHAHAG